MATVGTAKSVLVDKINSLTSSATPKDTIFLAKALGEATSLTNFVWKGAWATGTEYAIDDVVRNGNDSYVCVTAHTAGATFSGDSAKWELMMQGSEVPDQTGNSGKVLKTDGSTLSWGDGLPTGGTAGQYITTDGTTASWGDVTQKFVAAHTAVNNTRTVLSNVSSVTARLAFWSFTFDKVNADSDLYMSGTLAGKEGSNGMATYWWRVGTTGDSYTDWQKCGNHTYISTYGVGETLIGHIDTSNYATANATGTRKVQIAYSGNDGRPFNIWNPNVSDHQELYYGSDSRINIYEILP